MSFTEEEVKEATLKYFQGDELATNVFMTKYCLQDEAGRYVEKTPDDMHRRLASEFSRVEDHFASSDTNHLSEEEVYSYLNQNISTSLRTTWII